MHLTSLWVLRDVMARLALTKGSRIRRKDKHASRAIFRTKTYYSDALLALYDRDTKIRAAVVSRGRPPFDFDCDFALYKEMHGEGNAAFFDARIIAIPKKYIFFTKFPVSGSL